MNNRVTVAHIGGMECLINAPAKPIARLALAHGAGAPMDSDFMAQIAQLLYERDVEVVRFEFPYMARRRETGKKSPPDREPVLLNTWRCLVDALAETDDLPLFIGGKSMGGRMASLYAVDCTQPVKGVVCLGYPFHPLGKPEKLRTQHLSTMTLRTLIVQGTRDPMGTCDEVAGYTLSDAVTVAWLETANHDLKPLRKSGYTYDEYMVQTAERIVNFVRLVGKD